MAWIPIAAIVVPAAFSSSVLSPDAKAPNGLIYLAYVGAALLALGVSPSVSASSDANDVVDQLNSHFAG
jgi:hypothetical protein